MAYTPTYTAEDTSAIAIDVVGNFGAKFIPYISLVLLVALFVWLKKKLR